MLPRDSRLSRASDFKSTVKAGQRKKAGQLILYRRAVDGGQAQVGFIVGREVGNSVTRHLITRRLRHIVRQLPPAPSGTQTVIRCLPGVAASNYAELSKSLATIW